MLCKDGYKPAGTKTRLICLRRFDQWQLRGNYYKLKVQNQNFKFWRVAVFFGKMIFSLLAKNFWSFLSLSFLAFTRTSRQCPLLFSRNQLENYVKYQILKCSSWKPYREDIPNRSTIFLLMISKLKAKRETGWKFECILKDLQKLTKDIYQGVESKAMVTKNGFMFSKLIQPKFEISKCIIELLKCKFLL